MQFKYLALAAASAIGLVSAQQAGTPAETPAAVWPSNGLPPSRDDLINQAVLQVSSIIESPVFESNCSKCLASLEAGKFIALTRPDIIPDVLVTLCNKYKFSTTCEVSFGGFSATEGSAGSDIANVLQIMDPAGLDGQLFCHYQLNSFCPLPGVPDLNISSLLPPKPANLTLPSPSNETFKVIHVSDLHIDPSYVVGSESNCSQSMCCNDHSFNVNAPNGTILEPATQWGGYFCDVPPVLLDNTLQTINNLSSNYTFEFAIFTGDAVDHDLTQYLSVAYTMESEMDVYYALKENLQGIPVFPTLGNHDAFPYSQIAQNSSGFANKFEFNADMAGDLWADRFDWVDEATGDNIRSNYAMYAVTTKRGLRVISLNSNFWYLSNYYNFWNTTQPDTSGMFKFLIDELTECEKTGQRAWIISHVPTGGNTGNAMPGPADVLGQIVERFSPVTIAALFFGHTHEDQFQLFYAGNGTERTIDNALQVAFIAQSVTPQSEYNPGWRYYEVDSKTFSIMDSVNYYMPLNETFDDPQAAPEWQFGYSARETYNYNGTWPANAPLNATFWHTIANDIVNNKTTRNTFLTNEVRHSPYVKTCETEACLNSMYCYFTSGTVPQAVSCEQQLNITSVVSF